MVRDDWFETAIKSGKPKNTIENCECLLGFYSMMPRYNIIKKSVEIPIPGEEFSIDNLGNATLSHVRSVANRNDFAVGEIEGYIKAIAERNAYNPVANWIESIPWDGVDRVHDYYNTITSANKPLKELLMRRWAVSAIAALFQPPPFAAHGILVLQGTQGKGKTTWLQRLMPPDLSSQYIRLGMDLDPGDKDQVIGAITNWIVELGELGSSLRKDIDKLKAFCTNPFDRIRRPYDRLESEYARKTVFYASVNDACFLRDDTGNRRFWVIQADEINAFHDIDTQQLWAQFLTIWRSGERHYLNHEEQAMLEVSNGDFREHDPVEEMIGTKLDWETDESLWVRRSATQLLIAFGFKNPTRSQATMLAKSLISRGRLPHKSGSLRYFNVPPIKESEFHDPNYPPEETGWIY